MTFIKVLLSLIVFNFYIQAQTTYYISSSTGNDNNNGISETSAWKTLNKLHSSWGMIDPGNKILFKRGDEWAPSELNYGDGTGIIRIPDWKDGTSSNYITLGSYGAGNLPNLSGKNLGNTFHQVIRTGPLHYWKFENLRFEGEFAMYPFWGDDQNPERAIHHVEIIDCEFDGRINKPTRLTIFTGWQIYEQTQVPNPNNYSNLGWYPAATHDMIIRGNKFWNSSGEDCINLICVGDNIYVGYNEFYGSNEEILDIAGGKNHVVEYNICSGTNASGMKFHSQFSVLDGLVFRGNLIVKGTHEGLSNGAAAGFENVVNCKIYNNTLVGYQNGWAGWFGDMDRDGLYAYYGTFGGNEIKNNIFYGTVGVYGIWNNVSDGRFFTDNQISNNTYYLIPNNDLYYAIRIRKASGDVQIQMNQQSIFFDEWQSKASGGMTERMEDPQVLNPFWNSASDFGDFSLAQASPSINSGTEIADYSNDILGNAVPQDGITDRGAYEFNGVDITLPKVIGASLLNETTLLISFSESLVISSASLTSNYSISGGVTISDASVFGSQVTLTTSAHPSGSFTVTVSNIQDLSGNFIGANNTASYSFIPDNEGPELVSAQIINTTTVEVLFSEDVNEDDAENVNNYLINNEISIASANLTTSNKALVSTSTHLPGNYTITVINVRDIAGNTINSQSNSANYTLNSVSDTIAISSYNFIQGSDPNLIYDIAPEGEPVNLILENLNEVSWLEPYGISINSASKILSKLPSNKITQACKQSNEISIEVWLRPSTLNQNGPARIVSLSADPSVRNFTLGQGGSDGVSDVFDVRLRTTESSSNGLPSVTSQTGYMSATEMNHVVYTHNGNGESRIYVNAIEVASENIGGDFSNWDNTFHLIIGNEFTGDRPWLGEIYKLSIYNVALSEYKIDSLYSINLVTDLEENNSESLPSSYLLEQNYPNPFNPTTKIKFSLPETSQVSLKVYDTLGKVVDVLVKRKLQAGIHSYSFNAEKLSSGIYFYTLRSGKIVITKKMLLLK
jgi:concanavalin A-like lectin/glucanase superfamily protein/type IX secretion system substrate protein